MKKHQALQLVLTEEQKEQLAHIRKARMTEKYIGSKQEKLDAEMEEELASIDIKDFE